MIRIVCVAILLLLRELREWGYLLRYHYFSLPWIDVAFWYKWTYLWCTPHQVARRWMIQNGIPIHHFTHSFTYGETPLRTWDIIIRRTGIQQGDVVYDIGSGSGLGCFFLSRRLACSAVGIEQNDDFVWRAEKIRTRLTGCLPWFVHGDAQGIDYGPADVVYLFSTTFTHALYHGLSVRLQETLLEGALVISVSDRMKPESAFEPIDDFEVPYFFGFCTVYVHRFRGKSRIEASQ